MADGAVQVWESDRGQFVDRVQAHQGQVLCFAFSPDANTFASGSADKTITVWRQEGLQPLHVLEGHKSAVNTVAFSPDGSLIASGAGWFFDMFDTQNEPRFVRDAHDGDFTVRLWGANDGVEHLVLRGHQAPVRSVAFSPDGRFILSGSADQTARVWNTQTGKNVAVLSGHKMGLISVAWSADAETALTVDYFSIVLWSTSSWHVKEVLRVRSEDLPITPTGVIQRAILSRLLGIGRVWYTTFTAEVSGKPVAWFPTPLTKAATVDDGRLWAGCTDDTLSILRIESITMPQTTK